MPRHWSCWSVTAATPGFRKRVVVLSCSAAQRVRVAREVILREMAERGWRQPVKVSIRILEEVRIG